MERTEMLRIIGDVLRKLETDPQPACLWWDNASACTDVVARYAAPCSDAVVRYAVPCSDQPTVRYMSPCSDCTADMVVRYAVLD